MPSAVVKSFAKKADISEKEAEKRYQDSLDITAKEFDGAEEVLKRARKASEEEKKEIYKELSDDFWAYAMGVYKNMMGVEESVWNEFVANLLIEGFPSTLATLTEMTTSSSITNYPVPLPIRDPDKPDDDIEYIPFSRWDPKKGMTYAGYYKKNK